MALWDNVSTQPPCHYIDSAPTCGLHLWYHVPAPPCRITWLCETMGRLSLHIVTWLCDTLCRLSPYRWPASVISCVYPPPVTLHGPVRQCVDSACTTLHRSVIHCVDSDPIYSLGLWYHGSTCPLHHYIALSDSMTTHPPQHCMALWYSVSTQALCVAWVCDIMGLPTPCRITWLCETMGWLCIHNIT